MKLRDYVFCDDIRQEINNKVSLIGLYSDRIIFKVRGDKPIEWPLPIRLAVYVRLELASDEPRPDAFAFDIVVNGKKLAALNGPMKSEPSTVANISIQMEGVPLEPGFVGFNLVLARAGNEVFRHSVTEGLRVMVEGSEAAKTS